MRYEIKYWKLDGDGWHIIRCRNKNDIISRLTDLSLDGRVEDIQITDLRRGGDLV